MTNDTNRTDISSPQNETNIRKQARRLASFYAGKNIFITGATGFVGKVCLVKLMSSLRDCGKVYILLRDKKGLTSQQRFNKLLSDEPFKSADKSTDGQSIDWSKVQAVNGDMSAKDLGLSSEDKAAILSQVNIVINIAASVQFDAPLKMNLRDNYLGTRNLLGLAIQMQNLVSFVHTSTFYSNCNLSHIDERVVPLEDYQQMADIISWMPEKVCDLATPEIIGDRPNTYVYTKAMAENLVQSYEGRLPIAIVRPSIVLPSIKEPTVGWVDNVNGPMGLGMLAALGILRNIDWNYWGVADLIPVDHVANSILAIAERTPRLYPKEVRVYNCSSSSLNPVTWGEMFEILREESIRAPPYKMLRIPIQVPKHRRANKLGFAMTKLSEIFFAYMIDFILTLCGQKKILTRLTAKLHHGYEILRPFTINEFTCENKNMVAAFEEMDPEDKANFDFEISKINWPPFFRDAYLGSRLRLLKEDLSNVPSAIFKMRLMVIFGFIINCLLYGFIAWTAYRFYATYQVQNQIPALIS